jgi:integrase
MAGTILDLGNNKYRFMVWCKSEYDNRRFRKSKTVTAKSKREAEKKLAEFVRECEQKCSLEGSNMTFEQFSKKWIEEYAKPNLSPVTVEGYERELKNRINPALGKIVLTELKPMHIIHFYNELLTAPRLDGKEGVLSGRARNNIHRILSSMLTNAVYWQLIPENPIKRVRPPKQEKHVARFYTEQETVKMLSCLENEEMKYKVAVHIAILTGMRRGEILGLEWRDIDFEKREIHLERTSVYTETNGVIEKDTKTHVARTVSIPEELCELLKKYRKHWLEQKFKLGSLWQGTDRLMIQWDGRPMFPATLTHWFKKFLKKNDLPEITFHELRHTSATLLINLGVDIVTVAKRLGHAQNSTTLNFYTHAILSSDKVAAERLGERLVK